MIDRPDANYAPVTAERDVADLTVTGELPPELRGALLRNGPNPQFSNDHSGAHLFTGDGMLHAIRLDNGRAAYSNRWIRTPKFIAEHDAGHALYGGYVAKFDADAAQRNFKDGVANTHVVFHGGRLLALEEQHLPMEVDPATLGTIGFHDWDGALTGPFTAHPKIDPVTGEMVFFGYHADAPRGAGLHWGVVDRDGRLVRLERFAAPYASMVHDFIVTDRHVVFPIMPLTASFSRQRSGGQPYLWDPDYGTQVGVMRRDQGVESLRWVRGDTGFVFHVMNAFEIGTTLVADVVEHESPALFPHAKGHQVTDPFGGRLARWAIPLDGASDTFHVEPLDDVRGEFPRIDDRRAGLSHRYGWMAGSSDGRVLDSIVQRDGITGQVQFWSALNGDAMSEPVFVPRGDAEGDGWLLVVAWRAREEASDLVVLEARDVERGPIATVRLPQRVPFGFHGNWLVAA